MKIAYFTFLILLVACMSACNTASNNQAIENNDLVSVIEENHEHILTARILTAEERAKLTPQQVLDTLKRRNEDFVTDNLTIRNSSQRIRASAMGQYPKAVVLSCLDSRVPVEDVFHCGIGDIFVARVAGNIVNEDILGSLEYACKVSGSKVIVVLGHEYCGAITSAIKDVELGNITALLSKIKPAVQMVEKDFTGQKSADNADFVQAVCDENIHQSVREIREKSPILKEMENNNEIIIVGGIYDMETGRVTFYDDSL